MLCFEYSHFFAAISLRIPWDKVLWGNLESKILLPLLVSPLVALLLGRMLFRLIKLLSALKLNYDWIHWLSSGAASFIRGLNDTPKVVALDAAFFLVGSSRVPATPVWLFIVVALAMGVGSVTGGLKVTETLAEKVTKMDHSEGFAANLTTALLVGTSSPLSLPVSTTHISSLRNYRHGRAKWKQECTVADGTEHSVRLASDAPSGRGTRFARLLAAGRRFELEENRQSKRFHLRF